MNALANLIQSLNDRAWAAFLVDAAAKGLVVLAAAWAASLTLRRASAATRHLVWALALSSLVVIPVLSIALPSLALPVLPQPEALATPPVAAAAEGTPAGAPTVEAAPPRCDSSGERPPAPPAISRSADSPAALVATHAAASPTAASSARITSVLRHWRSLLMLLWAAGALAALLPLAAAAFSLWRMAHTATPVDENWVRLAADLSAQLHLRRKVRLVQSDKAAVPMTWGVLRPAIVLPPCADNWPLQRRRAVLLHELAHVERRDSLTQTLARIGCAAHWFNPLAWFAFGRLLTEREHASDDRVLAMGLKASDYAGHIVEVARAIRGAGRVNVAAIAFARSARIDRRLGALLDATRRRAILSTRGIIAAALLAALVCVPLAMVHAQPKGERPSPQTSDIQARGGEILKKMAEVNRYWLVSPPDSVKDYSYDFTLGDETTTFQVGDAANAGRFVRQGISFYSPLHAIALDPSLARIAALEIGDKTIRIVFALGEPMKQALGNGIQNTWRGYMEQGVVGGTLWLDAERLVPLEMTAGDIDFVFSRYADVGGAHCVPLDVKLTETGKEGMTFHWEFAVYAPGLWLLDKSISEEGVIASVSNVTVNGAPAQAARPMPVAVVEPQAPGEIRQRSLSEGLEKAEAVINANRAWLVPPLDARRGLVYEYRQEEPYLERIMFDDAGDMMAQLEKTAESPDKPTRQMFYGADGTFVRSNAGDDYVKVDRIGATKAPDGAALLNSERRANNMATGLGLECALTRLARNPEDFQIEIEPVGETTYRLVLTPTNRGAALFTGTMLVFTSWAYMHDVVYARSEILCDAATNRPLGERDLDADAKLVGSYRFFDYVDDASGAAPGRITAVVPYEKDGQDQSLEVDARFGFARPGVWLLEEVTSKFQGSESGSTGRVTVVPATPDSLVPIGDMLARIEKTRALLSAVSSAPEGEIEIKFSGDTTQSDAWAKAEWIKKAAEAYGGRGNATIAVGETEVTRSPDGNCTVAFTVLSDAYQREYRVSVSVELLDSSGRFAATPQVALDVRALDAPATRRGAVSIGPVGDVALVKLKAEVVKFTAAYHGHGMWMTVVEKSDDEMKEADKPLTKAAASILENPPAGAKTAAETTAKAPESSGILVLREDDGRMKGRKSIAGSGHFVKFQCPPGKWYLTTVEIYGRRYGYPQAPEEDWTFTLCGTDFKTVRAIKKPYSIFERASERWNRVDLPPLALPSYIEGETPKDFWVNIAFNPEQTKGVYLGYDAGTNGNMLVAGLPDQRPEALPERGNWMVRLDITQTPPDEVSPELGKWLKPLVELANDDGKSNGQKSYGGAGPAVHFEGVSRGATLEGFSIYGSMYGGGFDPADTYADYQVTDDAGKVILAGRFAYSLFGGNARWVDVHTDRVEAPQSFWVLVNPHAAQRKGIYFHYDTDAKTARSKVGTKFDDLKAPEKRWEWMIRAYVRESEEGTR